MHLTRKLLAYCHGLKADSVHILASVGIVSCAILLEICFYERRLLSIEDAWNKSTDMGSLYQLGQGLNHPVLC